MRYHKYSDMDDKGRVSCFRVYYRVVFTTFICNSKCSYVPIINTGASIRHIFGFVPKKLIRRNYKEIFRQYRDWNGVDDEDQ